MSGIDYSKWDKMDFSDDESDESQSSSAHPRVTRLDEPSRVSYSSSGVTIEESKPKPYSSNNSNITNSTGFHLQSQLQDSAEVQPDLGSEILRERTQKCDQGDEVKATTNAKNKQTKFNAKLDRMTKNGSSVVDPTTNTKILWSQDRNEVNLHIFYNSSTSKSIPSRDIRVNLVGGLPYEDRTAAVGSASTSADGRGNKHEHENTDMKQNTTIKGRLTISVEGRDEKILEGDLEYHVHFPEGEDALDWTIETDAGAGTGTGTGTDPSTKYLHVTLLKAVPMEGITVWWSRPLSHLPEIDVVADIDGRRTGNGTENGTSTHDAREQWKRSWDEAHKLFRANVKDRKPQEIDTTGYK